MLNLLILNFLLDNNLLTVIKLDQLSTLSSKYCPTSPAMMSAIILHMLYF